MASKIPYYKVYPGDDKRNGSRQMSLTAEGLYKRLKDEAHDAERRGYLSRTRQPMTTAYLAKICDITPDDLQATMTELVSINLVACAQDGTYYVPEIVRQDIERKVAQKAGKKGWKLRGNVVGPSRVPSRVTLQPNDLDLVSVVVSKTPAVKETETTALVPPERRLDPVKRLVMGWKTVLLGIPKEDATWDQINWARYSKAAKMLLNVFNGDLQMAADCMADKYAEFTKAELNFTLETVVKHAHDWRSKNGTTAHQIPRS